MGGVTVNIFWSIGPCLIQYIEHSADYGIKEADYHPPMHTNKSQVDISAV